MKKLLLKFSPFIISLCVGIGLYYIPTKDPNLKSLFINLSATFIGITLTYFCYTLFQEKSERRLQRVLFEYAKSRIDDEVLSVVNQLRKMVFPLEKIDSTINGISLFISLSNEVLKEQMSRVKLLGYQILKNWDFTLKNVKQIVESSYTLKYMTDDHIITLIELIWTIERLNHTDNYKDKLFFDTGEVSSDYKIIPPNKSQNIPDRSILLKKIKGKEDTGIVVDFGDIPLYRLKQALNLYEIKNIDGYASIIYNVIEKVRHWLELTDKKMFITLRNTRIWDKESKSYIY